MENLWKRQQGGERGAGLKESYIEMVTFDLDLERQTDLR